MSYAIKIIFLPEEKKIMKLISVKKNMYLLIYITEYFWYLNQWKEFIFYFDFDSHRFQSSSPFSC